MHRPTHFRSKFKDPLHLKCDHERIHGRDSQKASEDMFFLNLSLLVQITTRLILSLMRDKCIYRVLVALKGSLVDNTIKIQITKTNKNK